MLWKCCTEYVSKFEKLSSCHKTGKAQFSFKSQRRAIPKNVQTTIQLHVSHMLKVTIKILQARLHQYMNWEIPYVQAGFRKDRGTRNQIDSICWIMGKEREFQNKTSTSSSLIKLSLWLCGSQQNVENSKRDGNAMLPYLLPQKTVCMSRSNC